MYVRETRLFCGREPGVCFYFMDQSLDSQEETGGKDYKFWQEDELK
jgi:hypothetical protein